MRLRNKKGAQDIISKSEYYVDSPIEHKGEFNKLFKNNHNIEKVTIYTKNQSYAKIDFFVISW